MQCHLAFVTNVYKKLHDFVDLEKMAVHLVDESSIVERRKDMATSIKRFKNALDVLKKL